MGHPGSGFCHSDLSGNGQPPIPLRHRNTALFYILLSQTALEATIYRRSQHWERQVIAGDAGALSLPELDFSIKFARLYQRTGLVTGSGGIRRSWSAERGEN